MLRLLILCLVLSTAVTSEGVDDESSGDDGDDEDGPIDLEGPIQADIALNNNFIQADNAPKNSPGRMIDNVEKAQANDEKEGVTSTIVIAVVCVVALAAVAIAAVILVRRHMLNRQQGVYSVPVEQSEKPAI